MIQAPVVRDDEQHRAQHEVERGVGAKVVAGSGLTQRADEAAGGLVQLVHGADAGVGWEEAAMALDLEAFADWADGERVVLNVASLYREFGATGVPSEMPVLFAAAARLFHQRRAA